MPLRDPRGHGSSCRNRRYEEFRALLAQHLDRRGVRAVTLKDTVGDVDETRTARRIEKACEQRRRTGAVDVVIAEDRDRFAPLDGVDKPRHSRFHPLQRERLGHQRANRRVEILNGVLVGHATPGKHARKEVGMAVRLRDGERPRFAGDIEPRAPRVAKRRGRDPEDEAILRRPQRRLAGLSRGRSAGSTAKGSSFRVRASASDTGGIDRERALQRRTLETPIEIGAESRPRLHDLEHFDAEPEIAADHHVGRGKRSTEKPGPGRKRLIQHGKDTVIAAPAGRYFR